MESPVFQKIVRQLKANRARIQRLLKEGGWIITGQIASVLGALVLVRVLTEYLQPTEYGELALGLTIAGLVNQVAMGGITSGISRFYSIAVEKGDLWGYLSASWRLMGLATLSVALITVVLMAGLLGTDQSHWLELSAVVLIFSILSGYNSTLSGIQNAARQRAIVALHGGMEAWLRIGFVVGVILWLGPSSIAVVIGYALSTLLVTISQLFFLRRLLQPYGGNAQQSMGEDWTRQIWLFSWPLMAGGLFNWGYYASQRWALELFASTADVGKFYALTQIAYTPISLVGSLFLSFIVPILYARSGDPNNHERVANVRILVYRLAKVGIIVTFAVAGITLIWGETIFYILVADQYRGMSNFMPIVAMAAGLLQVSMAISIFIAVKNMTVLFLKRDIFGNTIVVALNFYATSKWGIHGLVLSMLVGSLIHLAWILVIVNRLPSEPICNND